MTLITETAPAKINLYLHIGRKRVDGLHELASLFGFAEDGDRLTVEKAQKTSLSFCGPFADELDGFPVEQNLVWRAADTLRNFTRTKAGAAVRLEKNLPIAAGLGGGSADAAAALRALIKLWKVDIAKERLAALAFTLGADVPACLQSAPALVRGAGEIVNRSPRLAPIWCCLVNPRVQLSTAQIFADFDCADSSPSTPECVQPAGSTVEDVRKLMAQSRNDLQAPAIARAPAIGAVVEFLSKRPGVIGARMSGSGATCFGLFASREGAMRAAKSASSKGWWAMASKLAIG